MDEFGAAAEGDEPHNTERKKKDKLLVYNAGESEDMRPEEAVY